MQQPNQQIQIKAEDKTLQGVYANIAQIIHTKEEFVLDFMNVFPPTGTLNARVVISPGHFKRMIGAMQENLKRYEAQFGGISQAEEPAKIGFSPRD